MDAHSIERRRPPLGNPSPLDQRAARLDPYPASPIRHATWPSGAVNLLMAGLLLLACLFPLACSPDIQDNVGPRVPIPNVKGAVERDGDEADDVDVDLRDAETAVVVAAVETDDDGEYTFSDIGAGRWEVKISGEEDGDFDSVSKVFTLTQDAELMVLPALDIHAYGIELEVPTKGGAYPIPTLFSPITFAWTSPSRSFLSARVQLYDRSGDRIWSSEKEHTESALWNGIANEGEYAGGSVRPGTYYWRVKLELGDETEARTESLTFTFD